MPGIEPGAFHMQSERSTTEPHPRLILSSPVRNSIGIALLAKLVVRPCFLLLLQILHMSSIKTNDNSVYLF